MKLRHAAALAAFLGLVVPMILLEAFWRFAGPSWGAVFFFLWPSSLELRLFENSPPMPVFEVATIYATSIGINMLFYAGIAWSAASIYSRVSKQTTRATG